MSTYKEKANLLSDFSMKSPLKNQLDDTGEDCRKFQAAFLNRAAGLHYLVELFEDTLETSLIVKDVKHRYIFCNRGFITRFGATVGDELIRSTDWLWLVNNSKCPRPSTLRLKRT